MLTGERVTLDPVRQADLATFYEAQVDLATRGAYFPLTVVSESVLAARFAATGFWERDEGTLLIRDRDARVAEKCGFTYEGVARGAFFNAGTNHDVAVYSLLRTDPRPWSTSERE